MTQISATLSEIYKEMDSSPALNFPDLRERHGRLQTAITCVNDIANTRKKIRQTKEAVKVYEEQWGKGHQFVNEGKASLYNLMLLHNNLVGQYEQTIKNIR